MTSFNEIKEQAQYLKSLHSARNKMCDQVEQAYLLVWDEEGKTRRAMENVKITKHPGARNKVLGAARLLTATDPEWSVPHDPDDPDVEEASEKIEAMAKAMWTAAGRVRQQPVHYDVALSALLFSEVHIAVTKTADMVDAAKTRAAKARAEAIAAATPYTFDVWDPRTGYPDLGQYGLTGFYREVKTTSGAILDEFPEASKIFTDGKRFTPAVLCHWWDYETRRAWVQGNDDRPVLEEDHGLPFIPVVVQVIEGSRLFSKPEYQRQPFLYTLLQSGVWQRQNLLLTVLYTLAFAIGSNPLYVYQANQAGKQLSVDYARPGGVATIEANETLQPMAKQVIDPSLMTGYEIASNLEEESTLYSQTLGQPLGSNATYSETALLHQAGRLPLVTTQRLASWAIADAVKIAIQWMKADGQKTTARYGGKQYDLLPAEIPDYFELEARLDLDLPQDMLQQAQVANMMAQSELASREWLRENILHIGQPKKMQEQIWGEQASSVMFQQFVQDQMAAMQQRQQARQQPPPGTQPPQGMPPQQMQQQGLPPEQMTPPVQPQPGPMTPGEPPI